MPRLSVLIIARNEEKNMAACLSSVAFADEIIVIDDMSEDDTAKIAEEHGARVMQRAMNGDFGAQQQFAIEQASGDWLLFLDCDERITPELAAEIQEKVKANVQAAYRIRRLNHFREKRVYYGALRPDYVCRLMPRAGVSAEGVVHQQFYHPYREEKLRHGMLHYTYSSWDQYYPKLDNYARLSAQKYLEAGKSVSFWRDVVLRPLWAFFKTYVIHMGFLDGKIGWVLSVNYYHYTLSKYVRFYDLKHPF
ncbi:MAG: glycosyltransferase family 2 protein [Neisseria sp.]|nr:glycosyltransferase family 2 protein [Neisseria sp.]